MKEIRGLKVLEVEDFQRYCPSFYATHPMETASDKYTFLNTRDIAVQLAHHGWLPVSARQSRTIDQNNREFAKHIIRWAHVDMTTNGERIEIVGINSHNRLASFKLMAGIFRLVCSNGLIINTLDLGSFAIKHIGDIEGEVENAVKRISGMASQITGKMNTFKQIELTPDEQGVFAMSAHQLIYPNQLSAPIQPKALLSARRNIDSNGIGNAKPDLWTTFNVVQENLMKGGQRGYVRSTPAGMARRTKTRAVKSIDKDMKLNQALWALTERMASLKTAAA
jgi:hypothetical protein